MVCVKIEAMNIKDEIEDILYATDLKPSEIERLTDKLLILHSVMLSETLDEAEKIATEIDNGKSGHSLGESQGFESGAEWVIERIKEKLHST